MITGTVLFLLAMGHRAIDLRTTPLPFDTLSPSCARDANRGKWIPLDLCATFQRGVLSRAHRIGPSYDTCPVTTDVHTPVSLFGSSVTVGGFKPDKVIAIIFIHFWFVRRKKYILEKKSNFKTTRVHCQRNQNKYHNLGTKIIAKP